MSFHPNRPLAESPVADNLNETGSTVKGSASVGTVTAVEYILPGEAGL